MTTISIEQVYAAIAEEVPLPLDRIDPSATLESLGIASLDVISVLFSLEDKFGVVVDQSELENVVTVGEFANTIVRKAQAGTPMVSP